MTSRFLGFISRIRNSKKKCLKNLLNTIEYDARSVTGGNLRKIVLQNQDCDMKNLTPLHGFSEYRSTPEGSEYKVHFINDILEIRENQQYSDISLNEIDNILGFLCTS